ncbi:tyrosine-type recombinase/integrase [Pseudoalteromonas sp. Of11M-6]|uniref:phage integrase n=1 Tax=Pseudoalteromonas sp. Of11M-6 TaxID=2917754 RepID=UPI001EF3DF63|nr:tyrosine-type recombinase/integrase [Pseudoalteromonas sp. Of11M-6]MCG7553281.1 tyrosine-type recombinase/integrase [Pseudoalteromonas sp. Of11M-6]
MTIKKVASGYKIDIRPWGSDGRRIRKVFPTRGEAQRYLNHMVAQAEDKPWKQEKTDLRKLSDIVATWYKIHGQTYTDPQKALNKLEMMCEAFGNPIAQSFSSKTYVDWRGNRMTGEKAISGKTANNDLALIKGVFNKLIEVGEINYPNPLTDVKPFRLQQTELAFLTEDEIQTVLNELKRSSNPHVYIVAKICLATGCRISEASSLKGSQVIHSGGNCKIMFMKTKGKKNRTVPITQALYDEIPKKSGPLFADCRKAFERAINNTDIILPTGQCSHVLRHTFASHFMMNGGNILVLQQILGHAKIEQTMVYAHFAPSHLEDAIRFGPKIE